MGRVVGRFMKHIRMGLPRLLATVFALVVALPAGAQVGMKELVSQGMRITLVYPTLQSTSKVHRGPFEIDVALNAAPAKEARHLIVMSHGTGGSAIAEFTLAATLARAGFVVAQPEHRGDNAFDYSKAGPATWETRPREISETIDVVENDAQWSSQLDFEHVGVHGMSAGGMTALVMAGAQWRMLDLLQHCARHLDEDIGFCLNGLVNQPEQQELRRKQFQVAADTPERWLPDELKTLHGAPKVTDKTLDARPDRRVTAVSALVPLAAVFTPKSLQRIGIPVAITTAGSDQLLLPAFHSQKVLRFCEHCILLSDNQTAGHFDWLSPWPAGLAQTVGDREIRGGHPHPEFTNGQRQQAFDAIVTFFKSTLEP